MPPAARPDALRICLVTDAFPPRCGGSGWSTFHLGRALAAAGHEVRVVKPAPGRSGVEERTEGGLPVAEVGFPFVDLPFVRAVARERLAGRALADHLVADGRRRGVDVLHAQHVVGTPPALAAARALGVPAVVTVRDWWPICYFTTWHVAGEHCPDCSTRKMVACMKAKSPRAWWAATPLMPAMRAAVRRRQAWLRAADAVVAVSRFVADEVVRPLVGAARCLSIPNAVDVAEVGRFAAGAPRSALPERFVLFAGKLTAEKGARFVVEAMARVPGAPPLVVAGEGPERAAMEARARALGVDARFLGWVEPDELARVAARAAAALVPSLWPEPLARTVLEAMAAGVPIVATRAGGIDDQLEDGRSGLVVPPDAAAFAAAVARLLADAPLGRALAEEARRSARARFAPAAVAAAHEAAYRRLVDERGRSGAAAERP